MSCNCTGACQRLGYCPHMGLPTNGIWFVPLGPRIPSYAEMEEEGRQVSAKLLERVLRPKEAFMSEKALCEVCGEPMPPGEEMFKFHGYSGDCPKPALPLVAPEVLTEAERRWLDNLRGTEGPNSSTVALIENLAKRLQEALPKVRKQS